MASSSKANPQTSTAKVSEQAGTGNLPVPPIFKEIAIKFNECCNDSGPDASASSNILKIAKFQIDCNLFTSLMRFTKKMDWRDKPPENIDHVPLALPRGSALEIIDHVPVITGDPHNGQLTTIPEYLEQTWPCESGALIQELRNSIEEAVRAKASPDGNHLGELSDQIISNTIQDLKKNGGPSLRCFMQRNTMVVLAYGDSQYLSNICPMLVWLGMVCQRYRVRGRICIGNFDLHPSKEEKPFASSKNLSKPDFAIEIVYTLEEVDERNTPRYSRALLYVTIAQRFPIAPRPSCRKGLQISADRFDEVCGFYVKSLGSDFYYKNRLEGTAIGIMKKEGHHLECQFVNTTTYEETAAAIEEFRRQRSSLDPENKNTLNETELKSKETILFVRCDTSCSVCNGDSVSAPEVDKASMM